MNPARPRPKAFGLIVGDGYDLVAGSRILSHRFGRPPLCPPRAAVTGRADRTARPHARTDGTARPGPARQAA